MGKLTTCRNAGWEEKCAVYSRRRFVMGSDEGKGKRRKQKEKIKVVNERVARLANC